MKPLAIIAGVAAVTLAAPAMAQPAGDHLKMTRMDLRVWKSCQAMSHDSMMHSGRCRGLMAKYPGMFNPDGTMKPGPMAH